VTVGYLSLGSGIVTVGYLSLGSEIGTVVFHFYSSFVIAFYTRIYHPETFFCSRVDFSNVSGTYSLNANDSLFFLVSDGVEMMSGGMETDFSANDCLDLARESEFDASSHPEIVSVEFLRPTRAVNLLVHLEMARRSAVGACYQVFGVQKLL